MIAALDPLEDSEIHGADLIDEQSKAILLALRTATDCFRVRGREIYCGVAESRVHRSSRLPRARVLRVPFTIPGPNTTKTDREVALESRPTIDV